jgi:hypothetical protein
LFFEARVLVKQAEGFIDLAASVVGVFGYKGEQCESQQPVPQVNRGAMSTQSYEVGGRRIYQVVDLGRVLLDEETQPRVSIDEQTVQEYVERMKVADDATVVDSEGVMFTPIVVFDDGERRWLADGFHRVEAAKRAGIASFQAQLRRGSKRDAILHSLGANARHGKRRTNADKRQAVERALLDEDWGSQSDSRVAEICCVSQPFVSKVRRDMVAQGDLEPQKMRQGADGKLYNVSNIGGQSSGRIKRSPSREATADALVCDAKVRVINQLENCELDEGSVQVLFARELLRNDWYEVANRGVALLKEGGVLIVPQTMDLCFAVSHLMRERIRYQGATVLPDAAIFQVWSSQGGKEIPSRIENIEELFAAFDPEGVRIVEFSPGHLEQEAPA